MREMKDSGIPWIGEIPENWDVKRLKQESIFINGFAFDSDDFKNMFYTYLFPLFWHIPNPRDTTIYHLSAHRPIILAISASSSALSACR